MRTLSTRGLTQRIEKAVTGGSMAIPIRRGDYGGGRGYKPHRSACVVRRRCRRMELETGPQARLFPWPRAVPSGTGNWEKLEDRHARVPVRVWVRPTSPQRQQGAINPLLALRAGIQGHNEFFRVGSRA